MPQVCPYCGQAITSDELARKIANAEGLVANELREMLAAEWGVKEKALADQVESLQNEAQQVRESHARGLAEASRKAGEAARVELAKSFENDRSALLADIARLTTARNDATKTMETQRKDLETKFASNLEKESARIFAQAAADAKEASEGRTKELEERLGQLSRSLQTAHEESRRQQMEFETKVLAVQKEAEAEAAKRAQEHYQTELRAKDELIQQTKLDVEKERFRLQKEVEDLNRRLERKTAEELGRVPEEELELALRHEFTNDRIERRGGGKRGGDLIHRVLEAGQEVGTIVYEVKNTLNWSNDFVEQAKKHRTTYSTPYVILVTRVFPAGWDEFAERDGILIVGPEKAPIVARILRGAILDLAKERAAGQEVQSKANELYGYLRSGDFKERVRAIFAAVEQLRLLQEQERRTHDRLWEKEAKLHRSLHGHTSEVESKIGSIVEGRVITITVPKGKRHVNKDESQS